MNSDPCPQMATDLYRPTFTHRMSLKRGFFPALQSLQYQLPFGISMLRHSRWNAAGHDSQHSRLPPGAQEEEQRVSDFVMDGWLAHGCLEPLLAHYFSFRELKV